MLRGLALIVGLYLFPLSVFADCVVDTELCRERGSFIYALARVKESLRATCKKDISVEIDWLSFKAFFIASHDYSISPCLIPLEEISRLCEKDLNATKDLLSKVDHLRCEFAQKDQRVLKIAGHSLDFSADLTNDFRSERPGPGNSDFIKENLKKLFKLNVLSNEEKHENKQKDLEKEREAKQEAEAKQREETVKKQVADIQTRAKKKAEVYQAETTRLSQWLQEQMSSIQKGPDKPEVKSQKMQDASKTYQEDLQKAIKAYGDGQ